MDRRQFLSASGALSLAAALPAAAAAAGHRLLVLVELKGGNDGLNTLVPVEDPHYRRLRPRLAVRETDALPLADGQALHPSLGNLRAVWDKGELAIVQAVGYPQPNLSHFRSIEIWDTASRSDEYLDEGWLCRGFAARPSPAGFAADGVVVGSSDLGPLGGSGGRVIALTDPDQFLRLARLARPDGATTRNASLAHVLRVEREIQRSADRLHAGRDFRTIFPPGPFGNATKVAAQLAANREGISVVRITLDGFDTHANQVPAHASLLRQLDLGLVALRDALREIGRWDDTIIATYAEFGRRPRENESGGTDHGTASAHFVLGGAVRGGLVGEPLRLDALDATGNPAHAIDFRDYFAALAGAALGWPRGVAPAGGGRIPAFARGE